MTHSNVRPITRKHAQQLRSEMTPPERALWKHLKALKPQGLHFRKQTPIGPYVADFAWLAEKLVVELDGPSHDGAAAQAHDAARQSFLESEGYKVLRFSNANALREPETIIQTILREVKR